MPLQQPSRPLAALGLALLLLAACVTINIYFPAAEARKAADEIVQEVLRGATPAPDPRKPLPRSDAPGPLGQAWSPLDLLISPAHAAEPDFTVDTPEIRRLQASMKSRNAALQPYYQSGAIGFTREALLALRDPAAVPLPERGRVQTLIDAENQDRNGLYQAIARANGHPEWAGQVRTVFAETWVSRASSGWWYQDAQGRWQQR